MYMKLNICFVYEFAPFCLGRHLGVALRRLQFFIARTLSVFSTLLDVAKQIFRQEKSVQFGQARALINMSNLCCTMERLVTTVWSQSLTVTVTAQCKKKCDFGTLSFPKFLMTMRER